MQVIGGVLGVLLVALSIADLVNTLISTNTSFGRWWPSWRFGSWAFRSARAVAVRGREGGPLRDVILGTFGPLLLVFLLVVWIVMQVVGFGLIWWALDNTAGAEGLFDAIYYSGIVFFTVGFGEIVPTDVVPRVGALVEALFGVGTVALVIGYLPTLYGAYSDRERALMTLDAGSADRLTPTELVCAWAPDGNPERLNDQFGKWEEWAAGILETHSTVPLLVYFRSHNRQQNWATALGLLADAAMHAQIIEGAANGSSYWFLRRAEAVFNELTRGYDISTYEMEVMADDDPVLHSELLEDLYARLDEHGFDLVDYDTAYRYMMNTRAQWAPQMEFLIDHLVAPRGFWAMPSSIRRIGQG